MTSSGALKSIFQSIFFKQQQFFLLISAKISNLIHLGQTKFKRCILNATFEFNTARNIIDISTTLSASGKAEIAKI